MRGFALSYPSGLGYIPLSVNLKNVWLWCTSLELVSQSSLTLIPRSKKFSKIDLKIKFSKMRLYLISAKFYVHVI